MKKYPFNHFLLFLTVAILVVVSCKKTDTPVATVPTPTTLKLQFSNSGKISTFSYKKNGSGFTADTIKLVASNTYAGQAFVLDESQTPAVDLTAVYGSPNKRNYIFIYSIDSLSQKKVTISGDSGDVDDLGYAYAQFFHIGSFQSDNGTLRVLVKYGSDKRISDPTLSGGTTFIDATFPFKLQ